MGFLNNTGLAHLVSKIKSYAQKKLTAGDYISIEDVQSQLPDVYVELDYIVSPLGAYINTNIIPTNHQVEAKFSNTITANDFHYFGTSSSNLYYHITLFNNLYYWGRNGSETHTAYGWTSGIQIFKYNGINNHEVIINGDTAGSGYDIVSDTSLYIGRRGTNSSFVGNIYYFKITNRSTQEVVFNGIPAKRLSDNAIGLYDTVSGTLFQSSSTAYTAGTTKKTGTVISSTLGDSVMTLNTDQKATAKKVFSYTEPVVKFGQETILSVLSTLGTSDIPFAMWTGRMIIGNKNRTFLLGCYRQDTTSSVNPLCAIGAHTWLDSAQGTSPAWEDVYLQPDGDKAIYIGGNSWVPNSGWFKVQNNGASSASFRTQINTGTSTSPTWRNVLPNMNRSSYSIFLTPYISNSSTYGYCVSIGYGATPNSTYATNIGYSSHAGNYGSTLGCNSSASGTHSVAIGSNSTASTAYSIQIGQGTNSTANTLSVGLSSSNNYQLLNSSGKIPNERLNLTAISGYDGTVAQSLEHDASGNLVWVNK